MKYLGIFVALVLIFSLGAIAGRRQMKVEVEWRNAKIVSANAEIEELRKVREAYSCLTARIETKVSSGEDTLNCEQVADEEREKFSPIRLHKIAVSELKLLDPRW